MPLIRQDSSRGAGGPREHRRSLAEFIGFDTSQIDTSTSVNHRANDEGDWRWDEPGSPEAAQTPRALVPSACFPPRHPTAFATHSESACLGSGWPDNNNERGMTDLVASLKTLAMPPSTGKVQTSIQVQFSYDRLDKNVEPPWPPEQAREESGPGDQRILSRRASFCGVVGGRNGCAVRWCGTLPARSTEGGGYSSTVFLGGLPWDITEPALLHTLAHFHPQRVEWPGREGCSGGSPRGFAYVTLESERAVRALLASSRPRNGEYYYKVTTRKMRTKEVQVIPWSVSDAAWVRGGAVRLEAARTVFVGALHGMLAASALASIMHELFSGVVFAGIDTDKNKYPIGSGRVTFDNVRSYVRAISAQYVEIVTDKFTKKVQVLPYLEDSMCSVCNLQQGPYFCPEPVCFRYYCRSCWLCGHSSAQHTPLMRSSKHGAARSSHADAAYSENYRPNGSSGSGATSGSGSGASDMEPAPDVWTH